MKKNKKNKIWLLGLTTVAATSLASISVLSSCNNTAIQNQVDENNSIYVTLTFEAPADVVLSGQTTIKIRKSKPFSSITPPIATKTGYKFIGWFANGSLVEPETTFDQNTQLEPHFERITGQSTITYSAGSGGTIISGSETTKVNSGTKFEQVARPTVQPNDPNYIFTGWGINDEDQITESISLTATYAPLTEVHKLTFKDDIAAGIAIMGNAEVGVPFSTYFKDINKPIAVKEAADFSYWADNVGSQIPQTMLFENDMDIYPVFEEKALYRTVSFTPNDETETISGLSRVSVIVGTEFDSINKPIATKQQALSGETYEFKWWSIQGSTEKFTGPIRENLILVPVWNTIPAIISLTFDKNGGEWISGAQEQTKIVPIVKEARFDTISAPGVELENAKFLGWYTDPIEGTLITGASTFTEATTLYAHFESDLDNIVVSVEKFGQPDEYPHYDFTTDNAKVFKAVVYPSRLSQDVSWNVYSNPECTEPTSLATISQDGILTSGSEKGDIYVQASATIATKTVVSDAFKVSLLDPNEYSDEIFIKDENGKWFTVSGLNGFSKTRNIVFTPYSPDVSKAPTTAENFNEEIYVGAYKTSIDPFFLANCQSFNKEIHFGTDSQLLYIGEGFMDMTSSSSSFNQNINLPNSVIIIGSEFMYNCQSFASTLNVPTSLEYIGDDFISNCYSFNSPIVLPNTLVHIGSGFLSGAKTFSQDLTLPKSIESIGTEFMYDCQGMYKYQKTIEIKCPSFAFSYINKESMFSTLLDLSSDQTINISGVSEIVTSVCENLFTDLSGPLYRKLTPVEVPDMNKIEMVWDGSTFNSSPVYVVAGEIYEVYLTVPSSGDWDTLTTFTTSTSLPIFDSSSLNEIYLSEDSLDPDNITQTSIIGSFLKDAAPTETLVFRFIPTSSEQNFYFSFK